MKFSRPRPPRATHKVSFWGVRCYLDCNTYEVWGVNWLCDLLIKPVAYAHSFFFCLTLSVLPGANLIEGFPMRIIEWYGRDGRDGNGGGNG